MLVSQYELLLNKRQFPKPSDFPIGTPQELQNALDALSREVIQGYFLTISNLSKIEIDIIISFVVATDKNESPFDEDNVVAVFDVRGKNTLVKLDLFNLNTRNFKATIPPKDTGLLIVQPNPKLITDTTKDIEIRGWVYVTILDNDNQKIGLLFTPEHRGTFFKRNVDSVTKNTTFEKLDQIAYTLPTANGSSLYELE